VVLQDAENGGNEVVLQDAGGGAVGYEVEIQDAGGWIDEVLPAGREKFERC